MKCGKKIFSLIMAIAITTNIFIFSDIQVLAHESILDIEYDDCITPEVGVGTQDGIDEMWYVLDAQNICQHISHNETTIKYYFSDYSYDKTYTWTTDVSSAVAQKIKEDYSNSMKKWNNVYFYSYNTNGDLEKFKIINIVEGTEYDHNLIIYPTHNRDYVAETGKYEDSEFLGSNPVIHFHFSEWYMNVNVDCFYENPKAGEDTVRSARARIGAHEIGHILGLRDIGVDNLCNSSANHYHHAEVIMGNHDPINNTLDITYKDVAGVAITRGFHTDNDHKWLNCGLQSNATYKILCSICNGVKYINSLSGYTYDSYNSCNGNHNLLSGNMMAVASYGTNDYYKCKYCRYVAPFSSIVPQNYVKTYYTDSLHRCNNSVEGLEYSYYEEHVFVNNLCLGCGFYHAHVFSLYVYNDYRSHKRACSCGSFELEAHYVRYSDIVNNRYANCLGCLRRLDLNKDIAGVIRSGYTQITENGSYILPNGIIVLVDEDVEAYLTGTLNIGNIVDR